MSPQNFIQQYKNALATQDWQEVDPLIHPNASITFSSGQVHHGKGQIQAAFERNFSLIKSEEYRMENIKWLLQNESTAVYLFDFYWTGIINGKTVSGAGRGTSVLIYENKQWLLLTEHLGKMPQ